MVTTLRGDDNFHSASPMPADIYPAKAWVNFKGTSTVTIRADENVSSVTDAGTARYRVNYSTALLDSSAPVGNGKKDNSTGTSYNAITVVIYYIYTTSCQMNMQDAGTLRDCTNVQIVTHR